MNLVYRSFGVSVHFVIAKFHTVAEHALQQRTQCGDIFGIFRTGDLDALSLMFA